MLPPVKDSRAVDLNLPRLLAYVADLELEVDRLRQHNHHVSHEVWSVLRHIQQLCGAREGTASVPPVLEEIDRTAKNLAEVLRDLHETPGYHPAHDQVTPIAVRALAEQVFRWQQRLQGAPSARLQLELESECMEWFPGRLRHILDNLFSNAMKYRDPDKGEAWVRLNLKVVPEGYELRISDNGLGLESGERDRAFDLFYRAAPARAAGLGIGLAVVKLLVEQSGGNLAVDSGAGQGTTFIIFLPRFSVEDFLEGVYPPGPAVPPTDREQSA
jgi:signal transduction histidine kinase